MVDKSQSQNRTQPTNHFLSFTISKLSLLTSFCDAISRLYLIPDNVKALKLLYLSDLYFRVIGKSIRVDSIIFLL